MSIILDILFNPWTVISILFWCVVGIAVYLLRNKKGAAYVFFPLLVMFKTKKLNNIIRKVSKRAPRFWRTFWTIGIFVSFTFTIIALWYFFFNLIGLLNIPIITDLADFVSNDPVVSPIVPLIPGVTVSIPAFAYLLLPILFVMTTHELAHGISASVDDVEVTSTGVMGAGVFFLIGFGAFCEVEERKLRSSKYRRITRLRIATSGTFINAITAAIAFIIFLTLPYMISPSYRLAPQVAYIQPQAEGGFNYGNLTAGDVIVGVTKDSNPYVYLNNFEGYFDENFLDPNFKISMDTILKNETSLKCAVGDQLTILTYNPYSNVEQEKNVTLGPVYQAGIEYIKKNDTAIEITKVYSQAEGGNNWNLPEDLLITEINGTAINYTTGDTLAKYLTNFNLLELNLTASDSTIHSLNISVIGIKIGYSYYTQLYWMHANPTSKFFGPFWPDFTVKTIFWLFTISISLTLLNMLPLPIFDGDRTVKEIVNGVVGEGKYKSKKKKEKLYFDKEEMKCALSEYRVEKINEVKIITEEVGFKKLLWNRLKNEDIDPEYNQREASEIILGDENYDLIDDVGDGFKDSLSLKLPEDTPLEEESYIEVSYDYLQDERTRLKKRILNTIRFITLFIILGNIILSLVKFGSELF